MQRSWRCQCQVAVYASVWWGEVGRKEAMERQQKETWEEQRGEGSTSFTSSSRASRRAAAQAVAAVMAMRFTRQGSEVR